MVATSADPDTPDQYNLYFTLQWGFRIGTGLRPRRLKAVFDKLVKRHDSLRLQFVEQENVWVAEVLDDHPVGLQITDLSGASADDRARWLETLSQTPIRAHEEPCFEMHLIACGGEGDVLVIRAHHTIIDGYGMVILIEDLLKLLFRMPLSGTGVSHKSFVTKIEEQTRENAEEKEKSWLDALLPLPEDLRIGRVSRGLAPFKPQNMTKTISVNALFSPEESKALGKMASAAGVTEFSLIYVAFAEAICGLADQNAAMICSWLGRHDSWAQRFVGCDIRMVQQIYQRSELDLVQKAQEVTQRLYEATERQPSDIFLPGSPFMDVLEAENRTLWRFQIHNALPAARLNSSPFGKFFWSGMSNKISLGPISIEKLSFPKDCESRFELSVFIQQFPEGPNAQLVADAAAFDVDDLDALQARIKTVLFP